MSDITIGDRQTVDRAKHPTLGEGRAVYDNGPCFFIADSGEVDHFARWAGSGSSSVPERRSYIQFERKNGERVDLDDTDRPNGPRHYRIVTIDGRRGWLVSWRDEQSDREKFMWERFEPDDGSPHEVMMIQVLWVGKANEKNSRKDLDKLRPWRSMESVGGHRFTYCHEADYRPPAKPAESKQLGLFGEGSPK